MLSISDLDFSYEKNIILKDLSIEIESGNIVGIMGPSGCGKSTLLRVISGFLSPTKGSIYLNKVNILPLQPQVRSTSMIFQGYSLFPHFTVFENLEYGLKIRKISSNIRKMRVEEILTMLELEEYKNVDVRFLSGGQKQRVAIGRSLAIEPDLLLLDEPLSAVDEKLRDDLRVIIRKVLKKKKNNWIIGFSLFSR